MAEFKAKKVPEVGLWLKEEGFPDDTIKIFSENDIDGATFLLLNEEDFKDMIKSVGIRRRLMTKREKLTSLEVSQDVKGRNSEICEVGASTSYSILDVDDDYNGIEEGSSASSDDIELQSSRESSPVENVPQLDTSCGSKTSGTTSKQLISVKSEISPFQSSPRTITKRKQEPPLPLPFELPRNFPPTVTAELENKMLTGKGRPKFIASIAAAIFSFKAYPTPDEFEHIGQQIIAKYPFLHSSIGTGYGHLKEALKDKLKYLRNFGKCKRPRSIDSATNEPVEKKFKKECKQFPQIQGELSFPVGEDEASGKRHQKMLLMEEKKLSRNSQTVSLLMSRTFALRRNDIIKNPRPVADVLKLYPSLKRFDQIKAEMDRIHDKKLSPLASQIWADLLPKVLKIAEAEAESNSNVKAIIEELGDELDEDSRSIAVLMIIYYLLPDTRVKSDHTKVIVFLQNDVDIGEVKQCPQPLIVVRGTICHPTEVYVAVEGELLCKVPPDLVAYSLLCVFYIFNMQYTSGCTNFFSFLEHFFLDTSLPKRGKLLHFITCITNI